MQLDDSTVITRNDVIAGLIPELLLYQVMYSYLQVSHVITDNGSFFY